MKQTSSKGKKSFTLIELLVVIAIIAILASILMPALSSARVRGRMVKCQGNIGQLAMVFNFYSEDSGGYLPCLDNRAIATDESACEVGDAPEEEQDTTRTQEGRHHIHHIGHLRGIASKLREQVRREHEEGRTRRVTHFELIACGDKLGTIPKTC